MRRPAWLRPPGWPRHPVVRRVRQVTGQVLLTLLALLGLFCLVITVLAVMYRVAPFIDVTASMEPAIPENSLILARTKPADEARPGDIVGVDAKGVVIVHRVVSVEPKGDGAASLELKGDASEEPDPTPYLVSRIYYPIAIMPLAGRIVYALKNFAGGFGLGALFGVMGTLSVARWSRRRGDPGGDREPAGGEPGSGAEPA